MVHATIILLCVAVIGINTISSLPGKTRVSSKIKLTSTPLFLNSPSSIDEYMQIWSEKCLKAFNSEILLHEVSIPNTYSYSIGSVGKKTVTFQSTAYTSDNFEYLRFVSLNGNGFNVLNILALPKDRFDVPIFGVDIVSLPGKLYSLFLEFSDD